MPKELKPYNAIIQVCPICGKVDASLDDEHDCDMEIQRQDAQDFYD